MRILTKLPGCTLVGLGLAAMLATPARSCTTICLPDKEKAVVAYNYDWYLPEGLVVVNKRGTRKISSLRPDSGGYLGRHVRQRYIQSVGSRLPSDRHQRERSHGLANVARLDQVPS